MEEYIEYLRNEFKKYKIFKQVSSYDGKKEHITYHYKLHINGLIKHSFEFKTAVTRKELEQAFIDSYIKYNFNNSNYIISNSRNICCY